MKVVGAAMDIATREPVDFGRKLAEDILKQIDLNDCPRPTGNHVLLVVYQRPEEKDLGGGKKLIYAPVTRDEDVFQSVVGLVIMTGPDAYKTDVQRTFTHPWCKAGDWGMYPLYESAPRRFKFNGLSMCMIQDTEIIGITPDPRAITG